MPCSNSNFVPSILIGVGACLSPGNRCVPAARGTEAAAEGDNCLGVNGVHGDRGALGMRAGLLRRCSATVATVVGRTITGSELYFILYIIYIIYNIKIFFGHGNGGL